MQVAPGTDGIQKLLAAEQDAQRIVSEARKGVPCLPGTMYYSSVAYAASWSDMEIVPREQQLNYSMPRIAAKSDRLRQAKAEAEKEIAAYRAEREGAYQKKIAEVRLLLCHCSPTLIPYFLSLLMY